MRLAAVNLTAGGISGGNKRFLEQMLPRLAAHQGVDALLCAAPASLKTQEWVTPHPKLAFADCRPFSPLRPAPDKAFKKILDDFRPDAVFMATERRLDYPGVPQVVMVQNMAPLSGIATTRGTLETLRLWARRWDAGRAVKSAAAVIAPTAFVKEALTDKFSIPPEKIAVINYGSTPPAQAPIKPAGLPEKLSGPFIFTAGSLEYYRGVQDALGALARLKPRFPGLKLAVAGGARPGIAGYLSGLKARARKLGVADGVFWLGDLSEREMSWCYFNCAACAVTSRVESFCLTALEALAHGCLCVSTDSPCLPEIFGPQGRYYRAGDVLALERELARLLAADGRERSALAAAARERARGFSWDKCADLIVKLLCQCL